MATNPNEAIFDAETRHAIYLERFGRGIARRMVKLLLDAEKDIIGKLNELPDGPTKTQQEALLRTVRARISDLTTDFRDQMTAELLEAADYEAEFTDKLFADGYDGLEASFQAVPLENVRAAVMSRPFQGIHLRWANPPEHASELVRRNFGAMQGEIERGFIEGESIQAITARIRPLIEVKAARDVETIAITAVKSISSAAREEFHAQNPGVVAEERWNAVLDGRTSEVCRSRDGKAFKVGEGPQPPAHPRCRSTRVGVDPDYPPPRKRTYDQWLRDQSEEVQDEILGKGKADLFRGGMALDRFYDEKRGRAYTLDELRKMDAAGSKPRVPPRLREILSDDDLKHYEDVLTKGKAAGVEFLSAYDRDTGTEYKAEGSENNVNIGDDLLRALSSGSNIVVHHNHPGSRSFSPQDLSMIGSNRGLATLYAHGHDGTVYRADRLKAFGKDQLVQANNEIAKPFIKYEKEFSSPAARMAVFHHSMSEWMSRKGFIKYSVAPEGGTLEAIEANKALLDKIFAGFGG